MALRIEVYDQNGKMIRHDRVFPGAYSYFQDFSISPPDLYCVQCTPGNRSSLIHKGKVSDKKFVQLEELERGDSHVLNVRTKDQQARRVRLSHVA